MNTPLMADLDELVLSVRNRLSRAYILEAIQAYRAGALRAAIVATWIAVVQDIISKLRELDAGGDANARTQVSALDKAIKCRDVRQLQRIESDLLDVAARDFELLAPHEATDLLRLKEDRNLCAHPAFVTEDALFQPTPEQTRAHIVHAILHLLRHQPVQGKNALDRALADVVSGTFPRDQETVCRLFNGKYLDHARDALVRNLAVALVHKLVLDDDPTLTYDLYGQRILQVLVAISRRHPVIYDDAMRTKLRSVTQRLTDDGVIRRLLKLLSVDPRSWARLENHTRLELSEWLSAYAFPQTDADDVFDIWGIPPLRSGLEAALSKLQSEEQGRVIQANLRPELADTAIQLYANAGSFRQAERLATSIILPMAGEFTSGQVVNLIEAARENNQIWDASRSSWQLSRLFDDTRQLYPQTRHAWARFRDFIWEQQIEDCEWNKRYDGLLAKIEEAEQQWPQ